MITVVGGIKGGSGKTTIATNLTVLRTREGGRVLLVDADEQNSASDWSRHREASLIETKWTTVQLAGKSLYSEIRKLSANYDDVIVDVGGRDTTSQRSALAIADIFIVPFKPRSFDMWTLGQLKAMINEIKAINPKLECYGVINQCDPVGMDNETAINIMCEYPEFKQPIFRIGNRKVFANAASEGLGVVEMKNVDKKVLAEVEFLHKSLYLACEVSK